MSKSPLNIVILAAGQGTRMRSDLPKVLHTLADRPLLQHVVDTATTLKPTKIIVVYGHGGEMVKNSIHGEHLKWVLQDQQLGTGHAVAQAADLLEDQSNTLVLYGDVPLTSIETLEKVIALTDRHVLTLLTMLLETPASYGRIIRNDDHRIEGIVEQKDANAEQLLVKEVNTGILAVASKKLKDWLNQLGNDNAQGEYYLTDIVAMAAGEKQSIGSVTTDDPSEVAGVNNKAQLAELERYFQKRVATQLMEAGVTLKDPSRIDVRGSLVAGRDVVVDVNTIFEGEVVLGDGVSVGANCILKNVKVEGGVEILPFTHIEDAHIGAESRIGPYARIRPETRLADHVHVGNFVEIKKSDIASGSKINHLSYVGDTDMGARVNIGAGTITCNYDGANKHRTVIGNDVFIGSDTQLVAPIKVGDGATLGAGTTLTKDAPEGKLTLSRAKQITIETWVRPSKKK